MGRSEEREKELKVIGIELSMLTRTAPCDWPYMKDFRFCDEECKVHKPAADCWARYLGEVVK